MKRRSKLWRIIYLRLRLTRSLCRLCVLMDRVFIHLGNQILLRKEASTHQAATCSFDQTWPALKSTQPVTHASSTPTLEPKQITVVKNKPSEKTMTTSNRCSNWGLKIGLLEFTRTCRLKKRYSLLILRRHILRWRVRENLELSLRLMRRTWINWLRKSRWTLRKIGLGLIRRGVRLRKLNQLVHRLIKRMWIPDHSCQFYHDYFISTVMDQEAQNSSTHPHLNTITDFDLPL